MRSRTVSFAVVSPRSGASWSLRSWVFMACPFGSVVRTSVRVHRPLEAKGFAAVVGHRHRSFAANDTNAQAFVRVSVRPLAGHVRRRHREGCRGLWAAGLGVSGRKSPHEAERHGLGVAGAAPARRYGMWEGPVPRVRGCVPGQVFFRHAVACRDGMSRPKAQARARLGARAAAAQGS
jgi:hypothetical protein